MILGEVAKGRLEGQMTEARLAIHQGLNALFESTG